MQRIQFDGPAEKDLNRAIVIGASMAGLLAARVLSEQFSQVLVLERDELPHHPAGRKGTPQVTHAHGLLARGRQILEELFPGYTQALVDRGAQLGDLQKNILTIAGGRPLASGTSGYSGVACSRLLIEAELRARVRALPNVQLLERVDVIEPVYDPSFNRVNGVRIRLRGGIDDKQEGVLAANLVVDCSGRGSRAPQWLRQWQFDEPNEDRVTVGISYVTAYFERKPEHVPNQAAVISTSCAEIPYPAVMIAQEPVTEESPPRWVVTVAGFSGNHPEISLSGLQHYAALSASAEIARVSREAKLIGEVTRYGFPHSQRRRYEHLKRFPERFLVMGDAIASFNPVYGQGMTVAACEAIELRKALMRGTRRLHQRFFKAAAAAIDNPWQVAVGADLDIPSVQGERTRAVRFVNGYLRKLYVAAEHDEKVSLAFKKVLHMISPPQSLFSPNVLARVLLGNMRKRNTGGRQCASGRKDASVLAGSR